MNGNYSLVFYDPHKHPCYECKERHATCHGTCQRYLDFEANRPRTPQNTFSARGKFKDPFHKKGRVIRHGT